MKDLKGKLFSLSSRLRPAARISFSRIVIIIFGILFILLASYAYSESYTRFVGQKTALLADAISRDYQQAVVNNASTITSTVAKTVSSLKLDADSCNQYLATTLKDNPDYANIVVVNSTGDILCSADGSPSTRVNVADRQYFIKARETKSFVSGGYIEERLTGKKSFSFAYPVFDEQGQLYLVAAAGWSIDSARDYFEELDIGQKFDLAFVDPNNIVIAHYPDRSKEGKPYENYDIFQRALGSSEMTAESRSPNNGTKIYCSKVLDGEGSAFVIVSTAEKSFAAVLRDLIAKYALMLIIGYVLIALAVIVFSYRIYRTKEGK